MAETIKLFDVINPITYRDIYVVLLGHLTIFDLGRMARVSRQLMPLCRREMVARIGPRNFEIVAGLNPHSFKPAAAELQTVQFNDLKYFADDVTDVAAYWPLVIALRRRYAIADLYIRSARPSQGCRYIILTHIINYWIHVGLIGCARLLIDSRERDMDFAVVEGSCECKVQTSIDEIKIDKFTKDTISALTQEQLFWFTCVHYIRFNVDLDITRMMIDRLDIAHFNLLADMRRHDDNNHMIKTNLRRSNIVNVRYDPYFASRTVGRLVQPVGQTDTYICGDESEYHQPGTRLPIFATLPADYEPEMPIWPAGMPLDTLSRCADCRKTEPPHEHLSYHSDNPMRQRWHECRCECHNCQRGKCGHSIKNDHLANNGQCDNIVEFPFCADCKCCRCRCLCVCNCTCGAICIDSCSCCRCMNGCICQQ